MNTQKTTEPKQNGEMEPTLVGVTVSPEECTLNGNKRMLITLYEGTRFSNDSVISAVFRGSEGTHAVRADQVNRLTYTVLIPAHHKPEQVTLSVIVDNKKKSRVIYRSHFLYTAAPEHYIAELLVQSVSGTPQLDALLSFVPPLKTKADLAAFDDKLTVTFSAIALPRDWTLVGYRNLKRVENGSTLLHFSARLGLVKFTRHLLSLPGAKEAVNMDNKYGMSPVEIASEKSNDTAKLLNDFAASVTDNSSTAFVAPHDLGHQQYPQLTDGFSEQQQQDYCGDAPVTTGVNCSEPKNKRQDKRRKQYSPTLARIKPKPLQSTAAVSDAKHLLSNLATTFSNSCPSLFNAATMNSELDCLGATEFTCASASSTNSDELPCTSSENSPEPSHRHGSSHKNTSMEKKNGVMMSNVPKSAPHLTSQHDRLHDSSLPSQSINCRHTTNSLSSSPNNSDSREDSVTPVQVNQSSDQEGTLKRQSNTSVIKCASADSSPSMQQRITSISLYVKSSKSRPPSQHQVTLLQHPAVEDDDMMATQSAPNILSTIDDHDSLTPITDHDDRSAESSTTPTATAATDSIMELYYNDNSSHPDCSDSSSDSEISSINDIHVLVKSTDDLDEQQNQHIVRRHSQTGSVRHSASDHCLLERATSPSAAAKKRHSDILAENPNSGILYSTGSEPVVSKPHISSSDLNLSSTDDLDHADSTDTLDELYEKQSDDGRCDMIQYEPHSKRSGSRPRSADISHVALHAKMKQMHAISSTPHSTVLRKVYSSSTIDDFHATQSITTSFRSHNKLHPKLVEEMYSVAENETTKTFQSKIGISKPKKFHPVSRNNSDVTGLKKQASHVTVKRSASAVSDSGYPKSERMLSRDSKDYSSSQESSTLSLRGSSSGAVPLLPPSPLISNITPVELSAPPPTKRRSGTISPSIPMLPAEDEEPVENVLSQPSIAGIMQSRKPMINCDPEIESSLDRAWPQSVESPAASQKSHQKKTDNKTNLKRAQTMMAEESSHRKFWFRNRKDKEKKKKTSATVKVNKTSSTYPRPNSASSNYINAQEEGSNPTQPPEAGNVFPVKQVSQRQSTHRMEVKSIHFSPTVSPTERPLAAPAGVGGDNEQEVKGSSRVGSSQSKPTTSTSSSNLQGSKSDLSEPPRKSRSSSELYETEKEQTYSNNNDTNVEEDESLIRAQEVESVTKTFLSYPELWPDHHDNAVWSDNVPSKVLSKMNKSERDRQAVIYELIQTENHILVAIQILLIVFKRSFQEGLKLPEEIVEQMFPHLDPLLALTQEFYRKLRQRQNDARNHVIDRIGDILVDHFTGDKGEEVAKVYGAFCSRQLRALDIYREQNKVKRFQKLASSFANTQICQRRNYPEFITLLAQRITKYPHLLARLSKKTDPKHHDAKDLELALTHSEKVTSQVNQIVDDQSRHEKLLIVQMNLEVHLPRWEKDDATRKELKSLNLMANGRNMIKMGHAKWVGSQHSQELPVLIVLVTDMIVILVERDQKYSLACLQDRKPPVIRLIDLIVRINEASVKSAVCELFLMEGGARPEFYTIQLANERELIEWKQVIQAQIEHCKQNNLKCEHFGSGHVPSFTTEDKKDHHHHHHNPPPPPHTHGKVKHDSVKKREKKKGNSKKEKYLSLCGEALELAKSMLSHSPSLQDFAQFQHVSRHGSVMSIPMASGAKVSSADKSSPKTRSRANTLVSAKPVLTTDDIKSTKHRGVKSKGTKVERSQTFLGKDEKKDRPHISYVPTQNLHHRSNSSASGGTGLDDTPDGSGTILQHPSAEQLQLTCIMKLVAALEGMKEVVQEQDSDIASLKNELSTLKLQLDQTASVELSRSNTDNDLLSMIDDHLLEKQTTMTGMSLEDLRHFPLNAYHSERQQNGSIATGRPQSISELPSSNILPSWSPSLIEHEVVNFNRTMSTDTT